MMDWEKAYRDHHGAVLRFLYHRTSGNTELARDLAQDTFVRAIRGQRTFTDDGRGLEPWLTTIARNLLTDHFKRSSSRLEVVVDRISDEWAREAPSAELEALEQLASERVLAAVARLPRLQKEAVVMAYWGRMRDRQIGAAVGVTEPAVRAMKFRARQTLRRRLAEVA